ncbi:MAG: hypothetical protein K0R85_57 [Devosia sp.]|jgi:hypothetical protein|nr:hypothetical protein [Devosia sp.]
MKMRQLLNLGSDKLPFEISTWFEETTVAAEANYRPEVPEPPASPDQLEEKLDRLRWRGRENRPRSEFEKHVANAAKTRRVSREERTSETARRWIEDCASREHPRSTGEGVPSLALVNSRMYLACQWHTERRLPLPPSLLQVLACVLELVTWHEFDDGSGLRKQVVPAKAIRECLGLPDVTRWAKLIDTARRRKACPGIKNRTLAAEMGVATHTIGKWSACLAKYADANQDYFFPLGVGRVPEIDATDLTVTRPDRGSDRRRPQQEYLPVQPRVDLFKAALYESLHNEPPSGQFLTALICQLDLIGELGQPLPAKEIVRYVISSSRDVGLALGLSGHAQSVAERSQIKLLGSFLEACSQDAAAMIAAFQYLSAEERSRRLRKKRWDWAIPAEDLALSVDCSTGTLWHWRQDPSYRERVSNEVHLHFVRSDIWTKRNSVGGGVGRMVIPPDEPN